MMGYIYLTSSMMGAYLYFFIQRKLICTSSEYINFAPISGDQIIKMKSLLSFIASFSMNSESDWFKFGPLPRRKYKL